MKKYLFLAASALALASCSSDDFIGNNGGGQESATNAVINFNGGAGNITRATSNEGTTEQKLDGQFKVYGVKSGTTAGSNFSKVFVNYSVWDATNHTTSNTSGWEYVAEANTTGLGTGSIKIGETSQTIKYWDYSAADYRFVAGSPISAFTYNVDDNNNIKSAEVTGLAGHINPNTTEDKITTNPVYVASPVIVEKTQYGNTPVEFTFVRQQSKVRVGIYETIPGYKITDIKFYARGESGGLEVSDNKNIILTSTKDNYFVGGTADKAKGTITYNWTDKSYTFGYIAESLTQAKNWYAGALSDGVKATNSTWSNADEFYGTDNDREDKGYFTVIPTPSATDADAILIKCDYTLISEDGSGETIKVTGATAAIPAAFCKWEPNVMYTYIFKISPNTNGTTGSGDDPAGLFPITFEAAVTDFTAKKQGTITTFTTPTITTYQEGSVTAEGVKYTANKDIYATVADEKTGDLKELTEENVMVYKLTTERSEADLQVKEIYNTEIVRDNKITTKIPTSDTTISTSAKKLDASKHLSFIPDATGYYAIQFKNGEDNYTYKVVNVQ